MKSKIGKSDNLRHTSSVQRLILIFNLESQMYYTSPHKTSVKKHIDLNRHQLLEVHLQFPFNLIGQ